MPTPEYIQRLREKVGHDLLFVPGAAAVVLNRAGHVLLLRRADNGRWHTPGGICEPGEFPALTVAREVLEETGLIVNVIRITGVYAIPPFTYPNGDHTSSIITVFLCRPQDDTAQPYPADGEATEVAWCSPDALPANLSETARTRIRDALADRPEAAFER